MGLTLSVKVAVEANFIMAMLCSESNASLSKLKWLIHSLKSVFETDCSPSKVPF